jgi:hypothetical protein
MMDPLTGVLIGSVVAAVVGKLVHGHFSSKTITGRFNPKGRHDPGTFQGHSSDAKAKGDNFRL